MSELGPTAIFGRMPWRQAPALAQFHSEPRPHVRGAALDSILTAFALILTAFALAPARVARRERTER